MEVGGRSKLAGQIAYVQPTAANKARRSMVVDMGDGDRKVSEGASMVEVFTTLTPMAVIPQMLFALLITLDFTQDSSSLPRSVCPHHHSCLSSCYCCKPERSLRTSLPAQLFESICSNRCSIQQTFQLANLSFFALQQQQPNYLAKVNPTKTRKKTTKTGAKRIARLGLPLDLELHDPKFYFDLYAFEFVEAE
jgi:hypothetical protein